MTEKYCGSLAMGCSVFSLCFSYFAHFHNFSDIFGLEYLSMTLVDRNRHLLVSFRTFVSSYWLFLDLFMIVYAFSLDYKSFIGF